ncbi:MAG: SPOR domain-containing protein [Betaproteobacteria bacterium]|nr:SPOR domain-containing protein [Betaproteobacteria bacterium]
MAFFKFRSSDSEAQPPASAADSLDVLRQRARQRLLGAAALVLVGVIGFPMVFDTQPRPVALDIPIDIPEKDKSKPVLIAPSTVAPADVVLAPGPVEPAPPAPAAKQAAADTEVVLSTSKPVEKTVDKPQEKSGDNAADAPQATTEEAKKARALLEAAAASSGARFVVQAGAFADAAAAKDARAKLERAGMKTYTHVADTKDGKRTRVRVGPVASLAEADKLAERIKKLDLPAQVLAL